MPNALELDSLCSLGTTVREALRAPAGWLEEGRWHLYSIHDASDRAVYVGKSLDPWRSLQEHVGEGEAQTPSPVGHYLLAHQPASWHWWVAVYDLWAELESHPEISPDEAEQAMIRELRPYFNLGPQGEGVTLPVPWPESLPVQRLAGDKASRQPDPGAAVSAVRRVPAPVAWLWDCLCWIYAGIVWFILAVIEPDRVA